MPSKALSTLLRANRLAILCLLAAFGPRAARAEALLPYTARTRAYSAWDTSVRGDLRTVGMAGSLIGLADSRIGSVENPAGLAMTVDSTGLQLSGSAVQDGVVQSYPSVIETRSAVASFCAYPWGLSLASWSPQAEGDTYLVGGAGGPAGSFSVRTQEYRLSAARIFLRNRLSLGLSLILGRNEQTVEPAGGASLSRSAWAYGVGMGALFQLHNRVLLGLSYTPAMQYAMGPGDASPLMSGYFQAARSPHRLGLGVGWVPNRFFRAAMGMYLIGSTPDTALLSDDQRIVGNDLTFQPRGGLSYLLAEYKELKVELAAGGYLEIVRIADSAPRAHATFGLEVKPWIFSFGWGLDRARHYQNFIYSGGIDVARVLRKLDLIPQERKYPYAGMLPDAQHLKDEGLPRPLVRDWKDQGPGPNVIDVGLEMPGKLRDRFLNAPEELKKLGKEVIETVETLPGDIQKEGGKLIDRTEKAVTPRKAPAKPARPAGRGSRPRRSP